MTDTRITIRLQDDDALWIKSQSAALGLDNEAAVVRMLIRQARLSNVSLNVVLQGPRPQYHAPPPRFAGHPVASVGEAYEESPTPIDPDLVDDMLSSRLQEIAANPIAAAIATVDGQPVAPGAPAFSLRPAPARRARDYR